MPPRRGATRQLWTQTTPGRPSTKKGGGEPETSDTAGVAEDEPTVPMERFVLPKDRDAARAARRRGSGRTIEGGDAEADEAGADPIATPDSVEDTITSGGSEEPEEAVSRPSSRGGFDRSPVVGVAAVDTLPLQPAEMAGPSSDSAAAAPGGEAEARAVRR